MSTYPACTFTEHMDAVYSAVRCPKCQPVPSFGDYRDRTPVIVVAIGGALIGAGLWILLFLFIGLLIGA